MAIDFILYDDDDLLNISDTTLTVPCKTDLSDGSHDYVYYFGSTTPNVQLQATSSPGVDNITLTPTYIEPIWQASTVYTLGQSVIPTSPNGYRYEITTAGTSSTTQPTWGIILNGTTSDGTAVWTLVAEDSPITEIRLATTLAGLSTATPGASLSLGNTILSGVSEAFELHVRVTNTITVVSNSVGTPELGLNINAVQQTGV